MKIRADYLIIIWMLFISGNLVAAGKIDTIYFQKGDRITGEVKSMENNQLRLSTSDASTLKIEWNKVDSVKIMNRMRIVLKDGSILYGVLLPSGQVGSCEIWSTVGDPRITNLRDIVELSPVLDKFANRLDGTLSSGFSYTKASDVMQLNLNGSIEYLAERHQIELSYDGILTRDVDVKTQTQNGGITFRRILPKKWFLVSTLGGESSTVQELDLRSQFGLGGGNSIVFTNSSHFYLAGGILGNREKSGGSTKFNLEALFAANYSVFIYESPEVSFNIGTNLIPSLNDLGRVRVRIDSNMKWEIFSDFFLKWTFFYSYDSRPLSETALKSDWAVSLIGLEYKL
jgi:hypothetical protein